MEQENLITKSLQSFSATGIAALLRLSIGILTQFLLLRLLTPAEIGVYALCILIFGCFYALSALGANTYIVQHRQAETKVAETACTFQLGVAVGLWIIGEILAGTICSMIGYPEVTIYLRVSLLALVLSNYTSALKGLLERDFSYQRIAVITVVSTLIESLVMIVLVLMHASVWSLVCGFVAKALSELILVLWSLDFKLPRINLDRAELTSLLRFTAPVLGSGALVFVYWNVDDFMVSQALDSVRLGYYHFAFKAPHYLQLVSAAALPVCITIFSKLYDTPTRLEAAFSRLTRYTAYLMCLSVTVSDLFGAELISFLFGSKWLPALSPFQIFMYVVLIRNIAIYWTALHQSRGITKYLMVSTPVNLIGIVVLGYVLLWRYEILGMSLAVLITMCLSICLFVPRFTRLILPNYSYLRDLKLPGLLFLGAHAVAWVARFFIGELSLISLTVILVGLGITYLLAILIIDVEARGDLLSLFRGSSD